MEQQLVIYSIRKGYRFATLYLANLNGQLVCTRRVTPKQGITRRKKYDVIAEAIREEGSNPPPYEPTKAEL